jgi:hypothetical protein
MVAVAVFMQTIFARIGRLREVFQDINVSEQFHALGGFYELCFKGGLNATLVNSNEQNDEFEEFYKQLDAERGTSRHLQVRVGEVKGDMLLHPTNALTPCVAAVGGPPCGPFSPGGKRKQDDDERADCFWKFIDEIIHYARSGSLQFFCVENSHLICKREAKRVIEKLSVDAPCLAVACYKVQLEPFLPSHRPRAFIVGSTIELLGGSAVPKPITDFGCEAVRLADILDKEWTAINVSTLQAKQNANYCMYMQRIERDKCSGKAIEDDIAIFDIDRAAGKRWAMTLCYNKVPAMRLRGPKYAVVTVDKAGVPVGTTRQSFISNSERFKVLGYGEDISSKFSKDFGRRATGNAYALPQIAAVVIPVMERIAEVKMARR